MTGYLLACSLLHCYRSKQRLINSLSCPIDHCPMLQTWPDSLWTPMCQKIIALVVPKALFHVTSGESEGNKLYKHRQKRLTWRNSRFQVEKETDVRNEISPTAKNILWESVNSWHWTEDRHKIYFWKQIYEEFGSKLKPCFFYNVIMFFIMFSFLLC